MACNIYICHGHSHFILFSDIISFADLKEKNVTIVIAFFHDIPDQTLHNFGARNIFFV